MGVSSRSRTRTFEPANENPNQATQDSYRRVALNSFSLGVLPLSPSIAEPRHSAVSLAGRRSFSSEGVFVATGGTCVRPCLFPALPRLLERRQGRRRPIARTSSFRSRSLSPLRRRCNPPKVSRGQSDVSSPSPWGETTSKRSFRPSC